MSALFFSEFVLQIWKYVEYHKIQLNLPDIKLHGTIGEKFNTAEF